MQHSPLNVSALSDALCIRITHTQPCIRPFYVHVNAGSGNSRWQLNSQGAPPSAEARVSACWQTEIRPGRAEWEPSERAQVSGHYEKICLHHSDLIEFPMLYTAASVQITIRSIFLICAHTVETHKVGTLSRPRTEQPRVELFPKSGE